MTLLPTFGLPTSAIRSGCARSRSSGGGRRSAIAWGQDMPPLRQAAHHAAGPRIVGIAPEVALRCRKSAGAWGFVRAAAKNSGLEVGGWASVAELRSCGVATLIANRADER